MSHAIGYKIIGQSDRSSVACEIHINGQHAATLRKEDDFVLHPASDFADSSVSPEQLQSAVKGAMEKLQALDLGDQEQSQP